MSGTNDNAPAIPAEEDERQRAAQAIDRMRQRVAMLMDELKSIFIPEMRLTFLARHPGDAASYTLLTEETDIAALAEFIKTIKASPMNRTASHASH